MLTGPDGQLRPLGWRSITGACGTTLQGRVTGKNAIQEAFRKKYLLAKSDPDLVSGQDWSGMRLIIGAIRAAAQEAFSDWPPAYRVMVGRERGPGAAGGALKRGPNSGVEATVTAEGTRAGRDDTMIGPCLNSASHGHGRLFLTAMRSGCRGHSGRRSRPGDDRCRGPRPRVPPLPPALPDPCGAWTST